MSSSENRKRFRMGTIIVGLLTFFVGVALVSVISGVFKWDFLPIALIAGGIGLLVYKFCCGSCCSR